MFSGGKQRTKPGGVPVQLTPLRALTPHETQVPSERQLMGFMRCRRSGTGREANATKS